MLKNLKEFKLPEIEEQVLKFWKQHSVFEQSLKKNEGKPRFVFFEGPPTANGMPGLHHLLARSFKDIIPRFKSMQGFDVPRKAGWDTHGLPVEIQAEKELGFSAEGGGGKAQIEKYGIAEFNAKCRELVWRYKKEFETTTTERLGLWLDTKNPYITYENNYIESLWWIIGKIDKRKLLYQGHKVVPWCTRCGTALSSHELAQGYKEVEDTSVYVKFKVKDGFRLVGRNDSEEGKGLPIYILSWTTTPWTLPGNAALVIGERFEYSLIQVGQEVYVLASDRVSAVFPDATSYKVLGTLPGKKLVGLSYEPLFDVKPLQTKKAYKVYAADFVTTTDGTGVVHTAVMYGEDDYAVGVKLGLPQCHTVTEQGHFTKDVKGLEGLYTKSGKAEALIIDQLTQKNLLLRSEKYKHDYPFCWRCQTALLYYARTSWFVGMSKLRKQLIANNSKINWFPNHIKEGRFGEWLREVKDWNLSRERYWGTPLPVWRSKDGKSQLVISSLADIKKYARSNGNTYWGIRHGEGTHNLEGKLASGSEKVLRAELTPKGVKQVEEAAKRLKKQKIQVIICSPYYRAQQTAKIVAKATKAKIITDKRLGEVNAGILNWQSIAAYFKFFKDPVNWFSRAPENGESHADVRRRVVACMQDVDKKFKNKRVLFVGHGDPLRIMEAAMRGLSDDEFRTQAIDPANAEVFAIDPPALPLDNDGKLDVHRPYIDRVVLRDPKTKKELHRVKEVIDVWFDSGAMPYAQAHYPFATKKIDFPADYIAEAIDQTRGWFYTLLAISTLLELPPAYNNVVCLGHIRDKNGQKMSKSRGNIVDPKAIMDKYGADAVRWYFFAANDPGDPKDFDEADLAKITRRFILILYNSFVFYNSYGGGAGELSKRPSTNVLDQWIVAALNQLVAGVTTSLEKYEIGKAAGLIETFADEMSRWYIRRSRDRFQSNARGDNANEDDYRQACATLHQVLTTLTTLTAPFMPFFSEAMYQSLGGKDKSVHLADWPVAAKNTPEAAALLRDMALVKDVAAKALAARAEAKIKVRQPLGKLTLKDKSLQGKDELLKILLDEVNVKEVAFDSKLAAESGMVLDTVITPQLREEGIVRELTRAVSGLRADAGYQMGDEVVLMLVGDEKFSDFAQRNSMQLKKAVNAKTIELKKSEKVDAQLDTKVDEIPVWIGVRKI